MEAQPGLRIHLHKGKALVSAGFLAAVGIFLLVGQFSMEVRGSEVLAYALLTSSGLFLLYCGAGMAFDVGRIVVVLGDDGIRYFPSRWPLLRQRGRTFVRWQEVDRIRFVHSRGARALDVYTKDSPPHKDHGIVNLYRLRPAIRLPIMYLNFSERELLREVRERAWKHGVLIGR